MSTFPKADDRCTALQLFARVPTSRSWATAQRCRCSFRPPTSQPKRERASRSSTCVRSRRSTTRRSSPRCRRPAAVSWCRRRPAMCRSVQNLLRRSPSAPSTPSKHRCCVLPASIHPSLLPNSNTPTFPMPTACSKRSTGRWPTRSHAMAHSDFMLPDVGEGLTEAEIVSWKVKPGDTVAMNQVLVEIETAKSLVELPSPFVGTVTALLVEEGQTVEVGTPIITVSSDGEPEPPATPKPDVVTDTAASISASESATEPVKKEPNLVGYGAAGH